MSGKSHGGRAKSSTRSKRKKMKHGVSLAGAQQQTTIQKQEPVFQVVSPSAKVLKPRSTLSSVVQHPYITTELRRIAILAGVMLAILVVLYLVIS